MPKGGRFRYPIGVTAYEKIFEESVDTYGLITAARAKEMGIRKDVLYKLVARGRLERIGHGVYQLACPMPYSGDYLPYAQSVALVGRGAYLYGESVLAMLRLAPTNPALIFVATPMRVRRKFESGLVVRQQMPEEEIVYYKGIAAQPVSAAIRACYGAMMTERLLQAVENGLRKEYLDEDEAKILREEIERHGR